MSLRRRFERLTMKDKVRADKLKQIILVVLAVLAQRASDADDESPEDKEEVEQWRDICLVLYLAYRNLMYYRKSALPPPVRLDRTIATFSESDCYLYFRFNVKELYSIQQLFNFNGSTEFDNREKMSLEEIMLRGLYHW